MVEMQNVGNFMNWEAVLLEMVVMNAERRETDLFVQVVKGEREIFPSEYFPVLSLFIQDYMQFF